MSFLLEPWKRKKRLFGSNLNILQGDNQLIVVARMSLNFPIYLFFVTFVLTDHSDTTASALTSTLYESGQTSP